MRRTRMVSFLCVVFGGAPLLLAQDKFELEYKKLSGDPFDDPMMSPVTRWMTAADEKPKQLQRLPEGVQEKRLAYFIAPIGGQKTLIVLERSKPARLWIDTDHDGDLSDEKPIAGDAGKQQGGWGWIGTVGRFEPFSLAASGAGKGHGGKVQAWSYGDDYLLIAPDGYHEGEVRLKGKSCRVALADGDLDGRYAATDKLESAAGEGPACDFIGVDLNRDGKFEYSYTGTMEIQPLPKLMRVDDTYYSIKVAPDASSIELAKATPTLGTLEISPPGTELMVWSENGVHHLAGDKGTWKLPVGRYACWSVTLHHADAKKAHWTLSCYGDTGKLKAFEVTADKPTKFELGPPLLAKTAVSIRRRFFRKTVNVDVAVVGRAGEEYAASVGKDGKRQAAPAVKIYDEKGKVVSSGKFEYG